MVLDRLDYAILAELDRNARLAESRIAKAVGSSKQVVQYRFKKLLAQKYISYFYTMIDVGQLGFDSYYIFIQCTGLTSQKEKELYKQVQNSPYVSWLVTGVGRWDAVVLICAQGISLFNEYLEDLQKRFGSHLHAYSYVNLVQAEHISYKFARKELTRSLKTKSSSRSQFLDDKEKEVLQILNHDARLPVTELATKTNLPVHVARYKLQQLQKKNIIQGFRPKLNVGKLGYQWHLLLIQFQIVNEQRKKEFLAYCASESHIYYISNTVGRYNLMMDIHVRTTEEFRDVLFDLKNRFSDLIKLYESLVVFEELLITYLPEIVFNS